MRLRGPLLALGLVACDSSSGSVAPSGVSECPPCECKCDCTEKSPTAAAQGEGGATPPAGQGESGAAPPVVAGGEGGAGAEGGTPAVLPVGSVDLAELSASASRKMMHDDGKGCLEDLDRMAAVDPKMEARLVVIRGQCEMLVGKCQEGKKRIARWYEVESAMTPERAAIMAEQMGSMRCREGDSSDRDRLLRALFELSDGAYMNKRSATWCAERVKIIRELLPKVPPRDADDTQISGGGQALFHTAAACHARAGDCKGAFSIYRELFPATAAIKDPAQRNKVVRDSFDSSIERCKGKG